LYFNYKLGITLWEIPNLKLVHEGKPTAGVTHAQYIASPGKTQVANDFTAW